ncbi:MAG: cbb3-type cytochrome oxidase assembly protein CcoS [Deltaproteobacteria bacterium]|nr:cbb3-type cytochrome oxidase assembly protein CcoS [Deltaproteobacteria bacterium]
MSVIYIVLPLAIVIGAGGLCAFIWAARSGQLDDLETPAHRILTDEIDRRL